MSDPSKKVIKPNFFIVGAAKCGTTAMYEYLCTHPDVFMPSGSSPYFPGHVAKEPCFFGRDLKIAEYWAIRDEQQYLSLFFDAGSAKRVGEASVYYLPSKRAAHEIKQFSPDAKIIIMLRNSVDMVYSLHQQFLNSSNEDIVDFEEALNAQAHRRQGLRIPKTSHFPAGLQYFDMATYSPQVKRYIETFGSDSVHIIIFDDLVSDAEGVYRRTLEFLGVDAAYRPRFEIVNAAKPLRNLPVKRFLKSHPKVRGLLAATLFPAIRHRIGNVLCKLLKQPNRPKTMDPALRRRLQEQFRPDIEPLSHLLGRDLSYWYQDP